MGSSDLSETAAECHFENLVKGNCCCEGRYSHILEDACDTKMVMSLPISLLFLFFSWNFEKEVLGNDAGKMDWFNQFLNF